MVIGKEILLFVSVILRHCMGFTFLFLHFINFQSKLNRTEKVLDKNTNLMIILKMNFFSNKMLSKYIYVYINIERVGTIPIGGGEVEASS